MEEALQQVHHIVSQDEYSNYSIAHLELELRKQTKHGVCVPLRRFDGSNIDVWMSSRSMDGTAVIKAVQYYVHQSIKQNISWKTIWRQYDLITADGTIIDKQQQGYVFKKGEYLQFKRRSVF